MYDLIWISPALLAGITAARLGLPPMVGYLLCGFALNITGVYDHDRLAMIGNLGVTLLLFTIGLKLEVRSLFRPVVWAGTSLHTAIMVGGLGALLYGMSLAGVQGFTALDWKTAALIGFALSLCSTVFAVKTLEDRGEYRSSYGKATIGVLIMQDVIAVAFLAVSSGKIPTVWALALLLLIPGRHVLMRLLDQAGHSGELQVLCGIALAFGSFALFKAVNIKGDLGALIVGTMLASHPLAPEISDRLLGFKDLLLVGFFLSIGMAGELSISSVLIAMFLALFVLPKGILFFLLFARFKMRARTAVMSSLTLTNYSEFGLIVGAVAVSKGWLTDDWLVIIALALTMTLIIASPLNSRAYQLYEDYRDTFRKFETTALLPEDEPPDFGDAKIVVVGMGELGTAVYDELIEKGHHPIGMDNEPERVSEHLDAGRRVVKGDATDNELWELTTATELETGVLTFKRHQENQCILARTRKRNPAIAMFAVAGYHDEVSALKAGGAEAAFSIYREAGIGLADEVLAHYEGQTSESMGPKG